MQHITTHVSSDCTYGSVSSLESDPMPIEGDLNDLTEIYVTLSREKGTV